MSIAVVSKSRKYGNNMLVVSAYLRYGMSIAVVSKSRKYGNNILVVSAYLR